MSQIDNQTFGAFAAILRKEKGISRKALAKRLSVSEQTVKEWESGAGIPEDALLTPLAQQLDVSPAELLKGQRAPSDKAALDENSTSSSQICKPQRLYQTTSLWPRYFVIAFVFGMGEMLFLHTDETILQMERLLMLLSAVFGAYFCIFSPLQLPVRYDIGHISVLNDGPLRMSMPGMRFCNKNWPHIAHPLRRFSCGALVLLPIAAYIAERFLPLRLHFPCAMGGLLCFLGGFFLPIYRVGRKTA